MYLAPPFALVPGEMKQRAVLRIPRRSRAAAEELTLRLQADGHRARRRGRVVLAYTAGSEESELLAHKLGLDLDLAAGGHPALAVPGAIRSAVG